ncbi:enoyl-CoA hydratase-related protein [Pseudooceanicola sp.]|uniref:enoyl-CoA hydratase-related protein n=1 Tax=Pseudooceanicola sp. TaxID=1914328 RepID=UPI00262F39E6|nr:enoyl-CoA hydratase-related protein [Pseudooceanicola sp.]MDF1856275.1 enoyl-CoA hydratase-related protein [Pseudooceanicola sp.]
MIDAETAKDYGLVSRVVPDKDLMEAARAVAGRIAANPRHAVRMTRRLLRQAYNRALSVTLELSSALQALAHETEVTLHPSRRCAPDLRNRRHDRGAGGGWSARSVSGTCGAMDRANPGRRSNQG